MKVLLSFCIVALLSCKNEPQAVTYDGNFKIEFLFEQDGCKMYRFVDGTRYVYWSNCNGKVQADYSTSNGKNTVTHYEETITTAPEIYDSLTMIRPYTTPQKISTYGRDRHKFRSGVIQLHIRKLQPHAHTRRNERPAPNHP